MLGGENIYRAENKEEENRQDLKLTFPWFKLGDGTKTYMKGFPEDQTLKTQDYPVVIWRKNFGTASVFAVNGDYMGDETGLGLLTGMVYETRNYLIYPVVNAQNLVVQNFPSLAEENTDKMQEIYGNGTKGVNRDIVWPSIAAIYRKIISVLPVWWHQNWIMMLRQKQMASCCIIMRSCSTKKKARWDFPVLQNPKHP